MLDRATAKLTAAVRDSLQDLHPSNNRPSFNRTAMTTDLDLLFYLYEVLARRRRISFIPGVFPLSHSRPLLTPKSQGVRSCAQSHLFQRYEDFTTIPKAVARIMILSTSTLSVKNSIKFGPAVPPLTSAGLGGVLHQLLSEYSCQGPDRPRDFVIQVVQVVQVDSCYATEMGTVRERPEQALTRIGLAPLGV